MVQAVVSSSGQLMLKNKVCASLAMFMLILPSQTVCFQGAAGILGVSTSKLDGLHGTLLPRTRRCSAATMHMIGWLTAFFSEVTLSLFFSWN